MRNLASILPILHISLASAQLGIGSGITIPPSQWNEALNKPNATGRFDFDGYDITEEYPWEEDISARAIDGWSWELNITAAISTANSRSTSDGFVAGANLRLHPPPSIVTKDKDGNRTIAAHESWQICIVVMSNKSPNFSKDLIERGRTDDGSCNNMLGGECRLALEGTEYQTIVNGRCDLPRLPKACQGVFGSDRVDAVGTTFSFTDAEFGMNSPNVVEWTSPGFKTKDNTSAYDILGQAYPVIVTWGFNQTVFSEQRNTAFLPRNTVTCVRATTTVGDGSVLPGASSEKDEDEDEEKDDEEENNGSFKGIGEQDGDDESGVGRGVGVSMWGVIIAGGVGVGLVVLGL